VKKLSTSLVLAALLLAGTAASADEYANTIALFQKAGQSGTFFRDCYGYAVFPTIGKGALLIGGARGSGRVYEQGTYVGDSKMTQLSIGLQAGGEAYSQIVFLQDKRAFDEFTRGNFEFDANASAVVITASASTSTGTTGSAAELSGGKSNSGTAGQYYKGMAVFTIVKGGALVAAAVAGQKFSYKAVTPVPAPNAAQPAAATAAGAAPAAGAATAGGTAASAGAAPAAGAATATGAATAAGAAQPPLSQQAPPNYQQPPPSYQQQAPSYQQPPQNYQQAPPNYQQPPPNYQQQSPNNQPPPNYQQQSPNNQPPPNYPQPPPSYQQAPPNYPQPPPSYQQAPPNYPQPPPSYQQAPPNYPQPPPSYQQPPSQ
jgi:lipid-binding SYLF domain-containing protein